MNLAFLPDLSALAILIALLLLLRRQHSQQQTDVWLLGLFITFIEALAHTFYAPTGIPNSALHVIVLDCYLLAGLVFNWASGETPLSWRRRLLYVSLNALPLLAINTLYGLHIRTVGTYLPIVGVGLVLGVVSSLTLRPSRIMAVLHLFGWMGMGYLLSHAQFRPAVYWSLSCVYTIAAVNFYRRLPPTSTGRLAILTGFSIWALCFLIHPWIVNYPAYADIASHVWNMQKSLISIGMILIMLEEQVSSNQWLALHDDLTGLPNRRLFEDRLANAIERSRRSNSPVALLLLDLNGFKKINDSLGHQAGDQVLREVAQNLRGTLMASDTLARLGGDEFVLLTSSLADHRAIGQRVDAIQCAVERPIVLAGRPTVVSASLGMAIYPHDAQDADTLLRLADQRMYALKTKPMVCVPAYQDARPQDVRMAAG
ncbi:GGDEF domain-containing protein [Granulicella sp. dw_53]|uniref:GGDEF domain-containing protein n=1 Tax=Granulicella sp. dw_53 TaxID=2719792 RepID=UPI001BD2450E|nr:GGDEF domain-containing protein [Granulicella sp. dw_53]